jgi:predicted nucleotide-binding protein (sugar kinase/HSP70/actin superfamily)
LEWTGSILASEVPEVDKLASYSAYRPRPLSQLERQNVTFLFGGLSWRAEAAIQAAFESAGLKARPLPAATREDLTRGRELADIGQCCPTAFVTGNLANFLLKEQASGRKVADEFVYVTAGSCGPCRFGQYHLSYELALRNLGLQDFRVFLVDQTSLSSNDSLAFGPHLLLGVLFGIMMTDVIQDFEYQTRPYEVEAGATERATRAAVAEICNAIRLRPVLKNWGTALVWHLTTAHFTKAMRRAAAHFQDVKVDRLKVRPKVKITGEGYLQNVEGDPNYNIHAWLETECAEVYPSAVTVWFEYLLRDARQEKQQREGILPWARLKARGLASAEWILHRQYNAFRAAFGGVPHLLPPQAELARLATPFYDAHLSGGEGDMLIGKAIWSHQNKKAHMICELSPYSCMPNTMSIGAMANVLGKYPDILYVPLEIKGDSEVHALSRCQMLLTEAKTRAGLEFEAALQKTGLTEASARERLQQRPELLRALTAVPRNGAVGTAANLVLELGGARF